MRPLVVISTYVYNSSVEEILNKSIEDLKKTGFDILLVSNSRLTPETINKANYYLYISDAIWFSDSYTDILEYDFWFGVDGVGGFELHHFLPSYQKYGLSVLRNIFTSLDLSKSLNYDSFFFVNGDNYYGDISIDFIKNIPNNCLSGDKKSMFYFNNDYDVSVAIFYSEINFFLENVRNVRCEEDYKDFLINSVGSLSFKDVERFLYENLKSKTEYILKKDGNLIMNDFPDTLFNLVTGVYNTSKVYNGCLTALFNCLNKDGEHIGFSVFSRNLKNEDVNRRIEIYTGNECITIEHYLPPQVWNMSNIYRNIEKIKIYENDVLLLEDNKDVKNYIKFK